MKQMRIISLCLVLTMLIGILASVPASAAGWEQYEGEWQYLDNNDNPLTGWQKIKGKWYYFDDYGWMQHYGVESFGSKAYYFANNGAMQTGWIKEVNTYDSDTWTNWYYAEGNGALVAGWKKISGQWYWFDKQSYVMASGGSSLVNGKLYVFQNNGALVSKSGWYQAKDGWYYTNADGTPVTGWKKIGGKWYYFTPDWGEMVTGGRAIDGVLYQFADSGAMISSVKTSGWKQINGYWFYLENGKPVTGWKKISGKWYYFDKTDGMMYYSGVWEINNKFYWFLDSGALASKAGWQKQTYGNYTWWYYVNSDGSCVSNAWKKIGGKWYYFDENAYMCDVEYKEIGNKVYSFGTNGVMRTGWIDLWGSKYYADPVTGAFVGGKQKIDGKWYEFDQDYYFLITEY